MTLWDSIRQFNEACSVRMRATPGWVPDAEIELAMALIDEERRELADALQAGDMTETADAIADGLYVRAGLLLRLGLARTYIGDLLVPSGQAPSWTDLVDREVLIAELEDDDRQIRRAILAGNLIEVDTSTHRTMYTLSTLAVLLRIPLDAVFAEVQRSNMAKLVDGRVVRHPQTNKVLKPAGWTPPDVAGVLVDHGFAA